MDFIVSDLPMNLEMVWHDFAVAIGLNHRFVFIACYAVLREGKRKNMYVCQWQGGAPTWMKISNLRNFMPQFDDADVNSISFENVENILLNAVGSGGFVPMTRTKFQPSTRPTCAGQGT